MMAKSRLKPHQASLIWAAIATLIVFLVPVVQRVLLPLEYLNTHLHELSHAVVGQFTGADVQEILVHANGSGETPVIGGNMLLTASAGYTGASIIGALMIFFGRTEKGARFTLFSIAAALTFSMIAWVRGDAIGISSGIGWIIVLCGIAAMVKGRTLTFCAQFLGIQQCLNALKSVFVLVGLSTNTDVHSDASILQQMTHIPSVIWAVGWASLSLVLVGLSLRKSWTQTARA